MSLQSALLLAKMDLHVFPLRYNSKLPAIEDFPNRATKDPESIRKMWLDPVMGLERPFGVGISTSNYNCTQALVVIDVDNKGIKNGSNEILRLELEEGCVFPPTLTQITPTGGQHLIYKVPIAVKQGTDVLGRGLDIRSRGGYIVGAGTFLDGKEYRFSDPDHPITDCPSWALNKLSQDATPVTNAVDLSDIDSKNALARGINYLRTSAPIAIQGSAGDQTTFAVAAKLKDFGIQPELALEAMLDHWNDRCSPPWTPTDLQTKIHNAFIYGQNKPGSHAPESDFKKIEDNNREALHSARKLSYKFFDTIYFALKNNFLIKGLLDRGAFSLVIGESNSGKTFAVLHLCIHIALGKMLWGMKVSKSAVLYIAAEGGGAISLRIAALRKHFELEKQEVPLAVMMSSIDLRNSDSDARKIAEFIKEIELKFNIPVGFVVVDTLARAISGGNENSSDDMGALIRNVDLIRSLGNCHVMVVHHTGKDQTKGARGHSSLRAAVDTEILVENKTLKVKKQRDMEIGPGLSFDLYPIEVGVDEDGESVTSCVVLPRSIQLPDPDQRESISAKSNAHAAIQLLRDLASKSENGKVAFDDWKNAFKNELYAGSQTSAMRTAFSRARKELLTKKWIKIQGDQNEIL